MSEDNTTDEAPVADIPANEDSGEGKPGIKAWLRSQIRLIAILGGVVVVGVVVVLVALTLFKRPAAAPPHGAATPPHAAGKQPATTAKAATPKPAVVEAGHAGTAAPAAVPATPTGPAALEAERKQLEQEREKLAAERKALDEARRQLADEQHAAAPEAARRDSPKTGAAGVGDCQLSGDVTSLREGLRRCLGLPEKPAGDAKADTAANKAASPPPNTGKH